MFVSHGAEVSGVYIPITVNLPATPVRSTHVKGVVEFGQEPEKMRHSSFDFRRAFLQDVVVSLPSHKQGERIKDNRAVTRRKPATDHLINALVVALAHPSMNASD